MIYVFYISLILILYTYIGYPLLMMLLLKFKKERPVNKKEITPYISIVIPAYNEEKSIGAKLNEVINLNYPRERMEVIVVSDASSDRTDEIINGFLSQGVKLFRMEQRSGKIAAYRKALPLLKGEIIVFSDATSILSTNSLIHLISNFNDETVGCAGGVLTYVNLKQASVGKGEKKYWSYEKRIREYENKLGFLPSVSGTFYAVRKELYPLDMKDDLADDLIVPFYVRKKGMRIVIDDSAICKDFTTLAIKEEMDKRIRITVQNIRGLLDQPDILNPFQYGLYSILVMSHKLFRLLAPVFLLTLFTASLFLSLRSLVFLFVLTCQILFYSGGYIGYRINKKIKFSLGNILFYFCLSNLAVLIGIGKFFKGERVVTWETVRG